MDTQRARDENDEEGHLHPSLITLSRDPFKGVQVEEYNQSRIVCASLEDKDHGVEDKELQSEAVREVVKRKEAFNSHAKRVYREFKNCDYNLLDVSCLEREKGIKDYYKQLTLTAQEHTHKTGELRTPF